MKLCYIFSLLIILVFFVSPSAFGHPGKTDYQDGHKCLRNCEDWDMNYDEYHLHDKDRNAIRTEGRKKPLREPEPAKKSEPETSKQEVESVPVPASPESQTVVNGMKAPSRGVQGYSLPVEEGFVFTLYDILLLGIAELLLLSVLALRRKRENK